MLSSSRILASIHVRAALGGSQHAKAAFRAVSRSSIRTFSTSSRNAGGGSKWERPIAWALAGGLVTITTISTAQTSIDSSTTSLDALGTIRLGPSEEQLIETTGDILQTSEPETGIFFPRMYDSKYLLGCGVRKKYQVFNVYAVGFYVDRKDFRGIPNERYQNALLDPQNHRTIRIVMNRSLTMDTVIKTLMESLEPRMQGKDLDS
jgi:hypothetical protein